MKKLSLLLMLGTVLTPWSVNAADCVTTPDCAELGFTADASKCEESALKCPWDTSKAACKEVVKTPLPVLYGDGTVAAKIIDNKIPIGVVFDETNKLAVALTNVKQDGSAGSETMSWSSEDCDTPGLENCGSSKISRGTNLTPITCGVDGRLNTDAMLVCGNSCGEVPAATATNSYQPTGCTKDFCKKTKWFLPSLRDLQNIYIAKDHLYATLTLLSSSGATSLENKYYWSSTETNINSAWVFFIKSNSGSRGFEIKSGSNNYYVRPVIYYGETKTVAATNTFKIEYSMLDIDCSSSPTTGKLTLRASATANLPNDVTVTIKGNIPNTNMQSTGKEINASVLFSSAFVEKEQTVDVPVTKTECLWLKTTILRGVLDNAKGSITGLNSSWNVQLLFPEVSVIGNTNNTSSGSSGGGGTDKQGVTGGYGSCTVPMTGCDGAECVSICAGVN